MIAGIKADISKELLWKFLIAASPGMSQNDKDGLGYAAISPDGIWGERWLYPADAWEYRKLWTENDEAIRKKHDGALIAGPRYNCFGTVNAHASSAVLLHARMATCDKSLVNTHPFVRDGVALIHNGVINNTKELKNITSTCDSECILNEYVENDVMNNPSAIEKVADKVTGYYCCGILSTDKNGRQQMDILRSNGASLYAYWVDELQAVVYCTSSEIIRSACKAMKFSYGATFRFAEDVMMRLDVKTGELISQHKYKASSRYMSYGGTTAGWNNGWNNSDEKKTLPVVGPTLNEEVQKALADKETNSVTKTGTNSNAAGIDALTDPYYWSGEGYPQYGTSD